MSNQLLTIKATCRQNDQCQYDGKDMFIDISITNNQSKPIGFPLSYIQKTGPAVRLFDKNTKAEAYLKSNLADTELKARFTDIDPGKSVKLEWIIMASEINQFGNKWNDLFAEITVLTEIRSNDKLVKFMGADILRIVHKK